MEGYVMTIILSDCSVVEINNIISHSNDSDFLTINTADDGISIFTIRNLVGWSDSLSATNEILFGLDK